MLGDVEDFAIEAQSRWLEYGSEAERYFADKF
jgi:hypothetical protein